MRFPSEWLPSSGRGTRIHDPDLHVTLDCIPKRAYDFEAMECLPRGCQIHVEILRFPGGMPRDAGRYPT